MKQLLIVCHSTTGGALQMAQAALEGARTEPGVNTRLQMAADTHPEHLLAAHGFLFAAPEYLAGLSGVMKDFFDRCYYPALGQLEGRPYASLICAGSDGQNAARQLARIATGWRLKAVAEPLIVCTQAQTPAQIAAPKVLEVGDVARCRALGEAMAAGVGLGVF